MFNGEMAVQYRILFRGFFGAIAVLWAIWPARWLVDSGLPELVGRAGVNCLLAFLGIMLVSIFFTGLMLKGPHERRVRT